MTDPALHSNFSLKAFESGKRTPSVPSMESAAVDSQLSSAALCDSFYAVAETCGDGPVSVSGRSAPETFNSSKSTASRASVSAEGLQSIVGM